MMSQPQQALRDKKTVLIDILSADSSFILQHVQEWKLVTKREYNNLFHIPGQTSEQTVIQLLDKVMHKGEDTCRGFQNLLRDPHIIGTYPRLLKDIPWINPAPNVLNNQPGDYAPYPAPNGPNPATNTTPTTDAFPVQEEVGGDMEVQDSLYEITSEPKGLCVIINNEHFTKDNLRDRKGTNKDVEALVGVFSWLGFRVLKCEDQTREDMERVMELFASLKQLQELRKYGVKEWSGSQFTELEELPQHGDAFICCILSHGGEEGICGTDGGHIRPHDILTLFNGHNCPALVNKPKVFFIQACRGRMNQPPVTVNLPDEGELQTDGKKAQYSLPIFADFLVSMATVEHFNSIRDSKKGTWFIQCLCRQLKYGCPRGDDIHTILTRVTANVCQEEGNIGGALVKQSPEKGSTLRKTLVFRPAETTPISS